MIPTFEEIYDSTLKALGVNKKTFQSLFPQKKASIVRIKQIMCLVAREMGYTSLYIAHKLKVDKSTVLYHEKKAREHMSMEKEYKDEVDKVRNLLGNVAKMTKLTGWLTRDNDNNGGYLCFTIGEKPTKNLGAGMWTIQDGLMIDIPRDTFPHITWDNEAQECEITLRIK